MYIGISMIFTSMVEFFFTLPTEMNYIVAESYKLCQKS